jgi:hypothetical protein
MSCSRQTCSFSLETSPASSRPRSPSSSSNNFATQGGWLVQDDADLTFEYVSGGYHVHLKKPGLWSSIRALPDEVESLAMDTDTSAENIELKTDFFGISCLTASDESFLFGMSPDGLHRRLRPGRRPAARVPAPDRGLGTPQVQHSERRQSPTRGVRARRRRHEAPLLGQRKACHRDAARVFRPARGRGALRLLGEERTFASTTCSCGPFLSEAPIPARRRCPPRPRSG